MACKENKTKRALKPHSFLKCLSLSLSLWSYSPLDLGNLFSFLILYTVDNIKMDLRETGWDGMDWIDLAQDRDQWRTLVNTVMNLRVP
jgi:hypothetical protein